MEDAPSLVMAPTVPWLPGRGGLRPLKPCKIMTIRWSVYSTECLATMTIYAFYHSIKPNIPFGNPRQGAPYYVGYPFSTEQVPAPTMGYPHYLPADPSQDAASEWRFHTRWVNHAEGDETHLTYGNEAYGGSVSGYCSDAMPVVGSWGTLTPQPLQNYDYSMVCVFRQIFSDVHLLILLVPSREAKHSI